ncbi:MAG TPA: hypothetical protein VFJ57_15285 [Solirubrobacterales bacterium]|nr:hypothetical protein [Solirubrobacterales bacterium]
MSAGARFSAAALLLLGVLLSAAAAAPAAEFGPIELVSKGVVQQADEAFAPAISADGRYVAFQGKLGTRRGIFRKDLDSGAVVPVATGDAGEGGPSADGAAPSISADGRYVAFTTSAQLDPDDDPQPGSRDVYVADMSSSPPSYELASALGGCDPVQAGAHTPCGLSYEGGGGSEASGGVALSADGREVVFFTSAVSNLTSGSGGSTEGVPTPAGQVVLRDLASDQTRLVSAERDPATGSMTDRPVPGGSLVAVAGLPLLRGAALSGDGSTVAWLGTHLPAQVVMPSAEAAAIAKLDQGTYPYDEPLWRRVADGAAAPIRRVVAADGAADPFVLTGKNTGGFDFAEGWLGTDRVNGVPRLSADGRTVALIGNPTEATNVFVVDMSAGLSRAEAVRRLTREIVVNPVEPAQKVNEEPYVPLNGNVRDLGISADGTRIAFASARQRFPLSPPNLVGSPPSGVGLLELYVIDLSTETLQRVTHGLGGGGEPSLAPNRSAIKNGGEGVEAPSFGAGGRIVFASPASNLVEGDSNEAGDVFLVEASELARGGGLVALSAGPPTVGWKRAWRLALSAFSLPDGNVRLVAVVPAAGRLRASVGAQIEGAARARKLPARRAWALNSGPVPIELQLPPRYRRLARSQEGLFATVRVSFHRKGRKALHGKIQVRFRVHPAKVKRP